MSLKTILVTIEEAAIAELKKIGGVIEHFVVSEVQKLVAEAKQSDLGTRAMNLISDLSSEAISGPEKMAKLVGDLAEDAEAFVANGGLPGLAVDVKDFVREFAQSAYNDFKAALEDL